MTYPAFVDLRSDIDQTYNQGPIEQCGGLGTKAAIETMLDRSSRKGERVSGRFIHNQGRIHNFTMGGNTGQTLANIADMLGRYGVCPEEFFPEGLDNNEAPGLTPLLKAQLFMPCEFARMPYVNDDTVESVKRSLCWGRPVVITMEMKAGFNSVSGNWKTHDWDASTVTTGEHIMCIVGYDEASQRFLVENSWGSAWGDGGFCGIPYDKFQFGSQRCITQLYRFNKLPVPPVKVDGFMPGIPALTKDECRDFTTMNKAARVAALGNALAVGGWLGVRDKCIEMGISDKLLEEDFSLPRGDAQAWFIANNIPQGTMIWLDIV